MLILGAGILTDQDCDSNASEGDEVAVTEVFSDWSDWDME